MKFFYTLCLLALLAAPLSSRADDTPPTPQHGDFHLLLEKSEHRLTLFNADGTPLHTYQVGLGDPSGAKQQAGDGKTPEGFYTIDRRNKDSSYYLSLHISYPDKNDMLRARKNGIDPGGGIFIHGMPNKKGWMWQQYSNGRDWTMGCIALSNGDIRELWTLIPDGTPIEIRP